MSSIRPGINQWLCGSRPRLILLRRVCLLLCVDTTRSQRWQTANSDRTIAPSPPAGIRSSQPPSGDDSSHAFSPPSSDLNPLSAPPFEQHLRGSSPPTPEPPQTFLQPLSIVPRVDLSIIAAIDMCRTTHANQRPRPARHADQCPAKPEAASALAKARGTVIRLTPERTGCAVSVLTLPCHLMVCNVSFLCPSGLLRTVPCKDGENESKGFHAGYKLPSGIWPLRGFSAVKTAYTACKHSPETSQREMVLFSLGRNDATKLSILTNKQSSKPVFRCHLRRVQPRSRC